MDTKLSKENKHTGNEVKNAESTAGVFTKNEDHSNYCYFRTVMLVMPFVTMVSINRKTHVLVPRILICTITLMLILVILSTTRICSFL